MWRSLVARSAGGGEVISSNLVTPTKSPNFQNPCFLPVFKAQQGIETYQNKKICFGKVHLAFLNSKNNKPVRVPEKLDLIFKGNYDL